MILTNDEDAAQWLRIMRFDGREESDLGQQKGFAFLGWNMYLQPEQAARGLLLFHSIKNRDIEDLRFEDQHYPDLSTCEVFNNRSGNYPEVSSALCC